MLIQPSKANVNVNPKVGYFRRDGTNLENNGEKPDIQVDQTEEDYEADKDPQLEKAVDYLMGKLKS